MMCPHQRTDWQHCLECHEALAAVDEGPACRHAPLCVLPDSHHDGTAATSCRSSDGTWMNMLEELD